MGTRWCKRRLPIVRFAWRRLTESACASQNPFREGVRVFVVRWVSLVEGEVIEARATREGGPDGVDARRQAHVFDPEFHGHTEGVVVGDHVGVVDFVGRPGDGSRSAGQVHHSVAAAQGTLELLVRCGVGGQLYDPSSRLVPRLALSRAGPPG